MVKFSDNILEEYANYLDDESSIAKNTTATRIWFPTHHDEVVEVVQQAITQSLPITVSGGGTGISGGRAPHSGWILATDQMLSVNHDQAKLWKDQETGIEYQVAFSHRDDDNFVTVPVGMSLKAVQNCVREHDLFYPPDPTERSSFIGGNVSTNASGARSFKFGATRRWVHKIKVVFASGESIVLSRDEPKAKESDGTLRFSTNSKEYNISLPMLELPNVTKHVAGPVLTENSQPIDLFIGTNGIFGIVTEVTLKLLPAPTKIISMFAYCDTVKKAMNLVKLCQNKRQTDEKPLPMSVEYLDEKAIKVMQQKDSRIEPAAAVVLLEQDVYSEEEEDSILMLWQEIFDDLEITDISVALTHSENEHHKFLRHWVPEWLIKTTKDYGYPIFVSDTSVPQENFEGFMTYLYDLCDKFVNDNDPLGDLSSTIIGHVGDSHPHLAFIPTSDRQKEKAERFMSEILEKSVNLGGSIASEHGLGKKMFDNEPAIIKQYGNKGIEEVQKLKSQLDPNYRLCPGNIIPVPDS